MQSKIDSQGAKMWITEGAVAPKLCHKLFEHWSFTGAVGLRVYGLHLVMNARN